MKVTRLVRPAAVTIVTEDGYRYEWPKGGEAVDVLPHHQKMLLSTKGAKLVDVEVVDQPVILPAFQVTEPLVLATVPAPEPEPDPEMADAWVEPAHLPEPEPLPLATVLPSEPGPDPDLTGAWTAPPELPEPAVLPDVAVRPEPAADPTVTPKVSHRWSEQDKNRVGV